MTNCDFVEVRLDNAGEVDEVVTGPVDAVHIERLDDGVWWVGIYKRGQRQRVSIFREGKAVRAIAERDD